MVLKLLQLYDMWLPKMVFGHSETLAEFHPSPP
jgi:hypothetical protein